MRDIDEMRVLLADIEDGLKANDLDEAYGAADELVEVLNALMRSIEDLN